MDTAELKLQLFRKIDALSEERLKELYDFVDSQDSVFDFWDELNDFQKADIKEGLSDLDQNRKKSLNEVLSKYK